MDESTLPLPAKSRAFADIIDSVCPCESVLSFSPCQRCQRLTPTTNLAFGGMLSRSSSKTHRDRGERARGVEEETERCMDIKEVNSR